jgi:MoaA/NifB/PqqE/SkfB family radical SAM enzyme
MCYIWKYPTHPNDEVSLATLEKIPSGIDNLNITGGEPTLRADLADIVDVLRPKARILEISSNGLHANRLEPIIKKYPDIKVRFSLEGFEVTNNRIRGETDGFETKVKGLLRLKELGGTDLGFGAVIQDDNVEELLELYRFCRSHGVEFATSALHNAFQFHKNDNAPYDRLQVAKKIEGLIGEMLRTQSVKNWFRAYLNLGLIEKVLGHDRLIACTAATDFLFVDPWSDVYACNVRPDLLMGNLREQSWGDVFAGPQSAGIRAKVHACTQNCWMVTTARTAMRHPRLTFLPKQKPLWWVVTNKVRVTLGLPIHFDRYIDYTHVKGAQGAWRESYLGAAATKRSLQRGTDVHYVQIGDFYNR